jgi:hypothetical protein
MSPFLADVRGGDNAGATAQVAGDVHEELRRESVDGSQLAPQDADLSPDTIDQCFNLGKLQVDKLDCIYVKNATTTKRKNLTRQHRGGYVATQADFCHIWQFEVQRTMPTEG